MNDGKRYETGMAMLGRIDGDGGRRVVESLREISPDFGRYLVEFPFGDIYSRKGVDLKMREIAMIAALAALGNTLLNSKSISGPVSMWDARGRKSRKS